MDGDQIARFAYLILLLAAVGGWAIVQFRGNFGKGLQYLAVWGLVVAALVAGYGMWNDIRSDVAPMQSVMEDGRIEIPRGRDGHYSAVVEINGTPVRFIVDTGASDIVLSQSDAARAGIDVDGLSFLGQAQTANGTVQTARVTLDTVTFGPVTDRNVGAVVNGGAMQGSLLGMAYLHRFSRIEISDGQLILTR